MKRITLVVFRSANMILNQQFYLDETHQEQFAPKLPAVRSNLSGLLVRTLYVNCKVVFLTMFIFEHCFTTKYTTVLL